MLTVTAVVLTVACVALTAAALGLMRSVADLRLFLTGHSSSDLGMMVDPGMELPEALRTEMRANDSGQGVIAFVSESCELCVSLAGDVASEVAPGPLTICVIHEPEGQLERQLEPYATVLPAEVSQAAAEYLRIDETPVFVAHRDGYIVGNAYGDGADSMADLRVLWNATFGESVQTH